MKTPSPAHPAAFVLLAAFLVVTGCSSRPTTRFWSAMGTGFSATLLGRGSIPAEEALDRLEDESHRLGSLFSDQAPASPLRALHGRRGDTLSVPPEIWQVLSTARAVAERSENRYDIGLRDVKALWNLEGSGRIPDSSTLRAALHARFGDTLPPPPDRAFPLTLLPGSRVVLLVDSLPVDLGGIGTGYAVDRMHQILDSLGFRAHLIQAGGEIRIGGAKPEGRWRIGIKNPRRTEEMGAVLEIPGELAVSTSGDYERFFIRDGVRYHHILDPRTGMPARGVASVSVLGARNDLCDALSTTLFVLGPDSGAAVARAFGVSALWIVETPEGLCARGGEDFGRALRLQGIPRCPEAVGRELIPVSATADSLEAPDPRLPVPPVRASGRTRLIPVRSLDE